MSHTTITCTPKKTRSSIPYFSHHRPRDTSVSRNPRLHLATRRTKPPPDQRIVEPHYLFPSSKTASNPPMSTASLSHLPSAPPPPKTSTTSHVNKSTTRSQTATKNGGVFCAIGTTTSTTCSNKLGCPGSDISLARHNMNPNAAALPLTFSAIFQNDQPFRLSRSSFSTFTTTLTSFTGS